MHPNGGLKVIYPWYNPQKIKQKEKQNTNKFQIDVNQGLFISGGATQGK